MNGLFLLVGLMATPAQVVEEIAQQIADRYVLVDEAPRIAERLLERAWAGAYERMETSKLAEVLTDDLRRISGDLHFAVEHDPGRASRLVNANAATSARLPALEPTADELVRMRRSNHGFRRAEVVAGNVVLLEVTQFDDLSVAGSAASAAMAFAADADAVIVDLRNNRGGSGNTVGFLASYFLPADTVLLSTFDRETGETTLARTLASVPGRRMPDVPLFILTGPATGSAAEAFAFALQRTGRATLVGTRTAGAAQGGGWVPVGEGFVAFIPTFRSFDPETGSSWERTGVQPDVVTSVERALDAAHLRAVAALDEAASRQELRWLLPLLDLAANGAAEHDLAGLAGRYEGIEITAVGNRLEFLGASGIPREVVPLSDGTFLIVDSSVPATAQARMRFVLDASGRVVRLELLTEDGTVLPRSRR